MFLFGNGQFWEVEGSLWLLGNVVFKRLIKFFWTTFSGYYDDSLFHKLIQFFHMVGGFLPKVF